MRAAPLVRDEEVADSDDGKGEETQHLQNEAKHEDYTAWDDFLLDELDAAVSSGIVVVCARDEAAAYELDEEGEEVEDDEGRCYPAWKTPERFKAEGVRGA